VYNDLAAIFQAEQAILLIRLENLAMKISAVVNAYNHEKYITQCLEGVLSQKGDFQLEVIVGDDCSTDQTPRIIEEFKKRYPEIIHVLPVDKNLGISKNLKRCLEACSGEYIAICEGDDYWTDQEKLQKQLEFLERRLDCSMCFSALMLYYEDKNVTIPHPAQSALQRDFLSMEDLIGNNYIGNFSCCMYRTEVIRKLPQSIYELEINTDDWIVGMACSQFGMVGFLQEKMSVYRIHSGGYWSGRDIFEQLDFICKHLDVSNRFFAYKYDELFQQRKKVFEEEVARLKAPVETPELHARESSSFTGSLFTRIKHVVTKSWRRITQKPF
jgi:glycosyltransferase involved in cell wall biosynthesis